MLGRWDEALAAVEEVTEEQVRSGAMFLSLLTSVFDIHLQRGELDEARKLWSLFSRRLEDSTDVQERTCYQGATAALARAEGRFGDALAAGVAAFDGAEPFGMSHQAVEQGFVEALEAAVTLGDQARVDELLGIVDAIPPGRRPPYLRAHALRVRARRDGDEEGFKAAAAIFREREIPFWLAVTLLEHGEWLVQQERLDDAEPLLAEAREIFEGLQAIPWLERLEGAVPERLSAEATL